MTADCSDLGFLRAESSDLSAGLEKNQGQLPLALIGQDRVDPDNMIGIFPEPGVAL